jgi:Flp pilus assembly protein TadD
MRNRRRNHRLLLRRGRSDGDLVNRGIEKAKNGDLDGAIADFNRAAELNPKDDAPYYNRAQANG